MASIQFPNFGNALTQGLQARAYTEEANQRRQRRELGPTVQAAIGGDKSALGTIAAVDPQYAMQVGNLMERLDDNQRETVKRAADFTVQAGVGILNTPPEQRAAAFDAARAEAQRQGIPTENWPSQWDAKTEGWIQFNVNKARPVQSYFAARDKQATEMANRPQPLTPGGAAPASAPSGGNPGFQNNVGNIRATPVTWQGEGQPHNGFETFATPEAGVRAMHQNLQTYAQRNPSMTVGQAIATWAPPTENDTQAYVARIAQAGIDPNTPLAAVLADPAQAGRLMQTMAMHEKGGLPAGVTPDLFVSVAGGGAPQGGQPAPQGPTPGAPQQPTGQRLIGPNDAVTDDLDLLTRSGYVRAGVNGVQAKGPTGGYLYMHPQTRATIEYKPSTKEEQQGPFTGKSVEAQALNMLVANGTLTVHQAAELAAGKTVTNPVDGTVLFMTPSGIFGQRPGQPAGPIVGGSPQTAPATPPVTVPAQPGAPSTALPGMIPITKPKKPEALKKLETEIRSVNAAIDNFQKVITEAGGGSFDAYINNPRSPEAQKVIGAFNAMKTALRSEAFVNTGVLQPAEMAMLDNMLLSPETLRGAAASPEAYAAMLDQIRTYIQNKFDAAMVAYGQAAPQAAPQAGQPKASAGGVVDRERTRFDLKKKYGLE